MQDGCNGLASSNDESFAKINNQYEKDTSVYIFDSWEVTAIVNLGKALWDIVDSAKPTGRMINAHASALPKGASCWEDLVGWRHSRPHFFRLSYKNLMNVKVIDYTYQITYLYNGHVDGSGKYLAGIRVVQKDLKVLWGYDFQSKAIVSSVINLGTREDPIAGVTIHVEWSVSSPLNSSLRSNVHFIRGDGKGTKFKSIKLD